MRNETVWIRGEVVNRERIAKGMTRHEFAELIGCNPRTASKMLDGGDIRITTARRLATALGLDVADVIDLKRCGVSDAA